MNDLDENLSRESRRQTERIAGRLRQSSFAFADGLRRAASVLRKDLPSTGLDAIDDPVFAAASLVAEHQQISLKRINRSALAGIDEHLEAICGAAQIALRKVTLERDWFRKDNGPLLGFTRNGEGEGRPVALLPRTSSGYEALDPERGERRSIGIREAEELQPTAYMFYRGFESAPVTMKTVLRFGLTGLRPDLARVLKMGFLGGLLSLALPLVSDALFAHVLPRSDTATLSTIVLALAMAALGGAAFDLVRGTSMLRVEGRMEAGLQSAIWDRLLRLAPGFFRDYTAGDLAERVLGITTIRRALTSAVSGSILDAIFSVVSFAVMFWYSWQLALIAIGLALIAILFTATLTALQIPHQRAMMRDMGRAEGLTYQLLTAIGKLRVAGAEARAFAQWVDIVAQQKGHAYRARRVAAVQHTLTQAFPPITSIVLYVAVIKLGEPITGDDRTVPLLTLGAYMAFSAAFGQFITALMSVVSSLTSLITIVPLYERLRPVLDHSPETHVTAISRGTLAGEVELRHVTFHYPGTVQPVLKELSFQVRAGEYVALVGPSGSGKSTIVRLLLGFETAQSGGVYFDQRDIQTLDYRALRRQIGVVLQSPGLLAGSLYENIAGYQQIPSEEVWEAARLAGLDDDIRAMPMGMHTYLSDSAPMLSGGQQQRVTLARALARKPNVLILDEATSALDNRTQAIIAENLAGLNITRIVIAHRLSTIRNADRILVLDQGCIVETGSYSELLARNGVFSEFAKRQLL